MLRYEDFQYTFRNVGSEFKSCVSLEISWQETADMTKKIKSKYNSATAEKALTWLNGKASGHESKGKPKVCGSRLPR